MQVQASPERSTRESAASAALRRGTGAAVRDSSRSSVRSFDRESVESSAPPKAHRFKTHTFRLAYCDFCGNFMWGLVQQGVRCEDCGFAAHRKCAEQVRNDCQPDLKYVRRTFGVDLTTLCMAHGCDVPPVVQAAVREVDARGLVAEGVYRVSGSHDQIERLRVAFDTATRPTDVDLSKAAVEDIHTVAGLLKLYLRLLPQPLVTYSVYHEMVAVLRQSREEYDQVKGVRRALETGLTGPHYATLRLLTAHLSRVARHSAINRMTIENLAMIFAPTILCHAMSPQLQILLPQQEQHLLKFLLIHSEQLFSSSSDSVSPNSP